MEHPWRLVVAWDEFSPGNKLKVDNTRKCMNLSFSFVELGQTALTQNWAWFTCVCLRSHMIARTRGGWSAYLRAFLRIQMLSAGGLATGGVPLCIGGNTIMLYARVANLLSDGDGLRSALDWKGHASMKPCFRHSNIFKTESDLAHRRPGFEEIMQRHFEVQDLYGKRSLACRRCSARCSCSMGIWRHDEGASREHREDVRVELQSRWCSRGR